MEKIRRRKALGEKQEDREDVVEKERKIAIQKTRKREEEMDAIELLTENMKDL